MTKYVFLSALLLSGCTAAADDVPEVEEPRGELVDCGERRFNFEQMTEQLEADEVLRAEAGFSQVTSCQQAEAFEDAYYAVTESAPSWVAEMEDDDNAGTENVGTDSAAIMNGTISGSPGVVEIGGCTGVLISPRAILTAAHCVDGLIAGYNGWATRTINKWVYNSVVPQKVTAYSGSVRINIHPSYNGTASNDIAVVKLLPPNNFPNFTETDRHRIWTGQLSSLGSMWLYGRGISSNGGNSGTLRYMPYNDNWSNGSYFISNAGFARACSGDSGGPVKGVASTGFWAVSGLHVNHDGPIGCTPEGNKQRAVRLQNKVAWIEDMIDFNCVESTTGDYVRCWED